MATPLITRAQLASRLRIAEADLDVDDADLAIANASGLVRALAGPQTLSFVSQETVILLGGERTLRLPERPAVVDGGNPLTVVELGDFGGIDLPMVEGVDFVRTGNELSRGYSAATSRLQGWPRMRPWGIWAPRVRVTYSHGYATLPDHITSIVLDVAASLYDNPTGLRQMSVDDYSETVAVEMLGAATVGSIKQQLGETGTRRRAFSIRLS